MTSSLGLSSAFCCGSSRHLSSHRLVGRRYSLPISKGACLQSALVYPETSLRFCEVDASLSTCLLLLAAAFLVAAEAAPAAAAAVAAGCSLPLDSSSLALFMCS